MHVDFRLVYDTGEDFFTARIRKKVAFHEVEAELMLSEQMEELMKGS